MNGTSFVWNGRSFVFDIDERIDPDLFFAATEAWGFLDESLDGLRLNRDESAFASRVLLIYFATRIHGATAGASMVLAHRFGREAIILNRCQYEYFIKMLYYDHFGEKAAKVIELLEAHDFKFARKVGVELATRWSEEDIQRLNVLVKQAEDANFTNTIIKNLKTDPEFLRSSTGENPFAAWFIENCESSFRTHWNYGSTIVHAEPVDLVRVVVPRADGHFDVTVDSRMKGPNKTISDLAQRAFSAMGMIRWRFDLPFEEKHIAWAQRFQETADRHKDEPVDTSSMHD